MAEDKELHHAAHAQREMARGIELGVQMTLQGAENKAIEIAARLGRAAGPMRNKQMLEEGKPDLVVAFPGGAGTENMVKQAKAAGIRVLRIETAIQ